ncbi:hypothetical protein NY78_3162 [Desulfovibrio sp. TomC]|nr:hypothetical protein NY78_3162 [Desulfovibrio sp. TomC]
MPFDHKLPKPFQTVLHCPPRVGPSGPAVPGLDDAGRPPTKRTPASLSSVPENVILVDRL